LRGDEIRACWEASTVPVEVAPTPGEHRPIAPLHVVEDRTPVRKLEFVEVGSTPAAPSRRRSPPVESAEVTGNVEPGDAPAPVIVVNAGEPRWSLWSDTEV